MKHTQDKHENILCFTMLVFRIELSLIVRIRLNWAYLHQSEVTGQRCVSNFLFWECTRCTYFQLLCLPLCVLTTSMPSTNLHFIYLKGTATISNLLLWGFWSNYKLTFFSYMIVFSTYLSSLLNAPKQINPCLWMPLTDFSEQGIRLWTLLFLFVIFIKLNLFYQNCSANCCRAFAQGRLFCTVCPGLEHMIILPFSLKYE